MKKTYALCALVTSMMLTNVFATTNSDFHQATVVSVEQEVSPAANAGASSDAPLRDASYSYDIAIRVGEIVYQTSLPVSVRRCIAGFRHRSGRPG